MSGLWERYLLEMQKRESSSSKSVPTSAAICGILVAMEEKTRPMPNLEGLGDLMIRPLGARDCVQSVVAVADVEVRRARRARPTMLA